MKPCLIESAYNDVGLTFYDKITYIDKGQVIFLMTEHPSYAHNKLLAVY